MEGVRTAQVNRATKETQVAVEVNLDGSGTTDVSTGVPFFDHMLDQLGRHGGIDLTVRTDGDVEVDAHHTVEDTCLALGEALAEALGDKAGVRRFASGLFPLDEALVEVAMDLSGRPFSAVTLGLEGTPGLGTPPFPPEMAEHALGSLATAARLTLHVTRRSGTNSHHIVEAAFKGVARCLREAVRVDGNDVPSTKGTL